jgi:sirohydrochlorin cobaltochelatase
MGVAVKSPYAHRKRLDGTAFKEKEEATMRQKNIVVIACAILIIFAAGTALAGAHGEKKAGKTAILLVAFGTSVPQAQKAFDVVEARVKKAFPGISVRWAFTSRIIRKKLAAQGKKLDSPAVALAKFLQDGYTQVLVSSLHSLPGEEFHDLSKIVGAFQNMKRSANPKIVLSRPLLSSRKNMEAVVKALIAQVPKSRKPEDAVLVMGHGSEHHPGDAVYAATAFYAKDIDPNFYVGTVEGQPKLEDIIPKLKKRGVKKAYLLPLMAVAGDHARNDMCGKEDDSWKSILGKNGIAAECILKGTAENPEIVDIWLGNMKRAYSHLQETKK